MTTQSGSSRWRRLRDTLASVGLELLLTPKRRADAVGGHAPGTKKADELEPPPEDWMQNRERRQC